MRGAMAEGGEELCESDAEWLEAGLASKGVGGWNSSSHIQWLP